MKIGFDIELQDVNGEILYKTLKDLPKKVREKIIVDFKLRLK